MKYSYVSFRKMNKPVCLCWMRMGEEQWIAHSRHLANMQKGKKEDTFQ